MFFFGSGTGRITHVGIYVGDGKMIHLFKQEMKLKYLRFIKIMFAQEDIYKDLKY